MTITDLFQALFSLVAIVISLAGFFLSKRPTVASVHLWDVETILNSSPTPTGFDTKHTFRFKYKNYGTMEDTEIVETRMITIQNGTITNDLLNPGTVGKIGPGVESAFNIDILTTSIVTNQLRQSLSLPNTGQLTVDDCNAILASTIPEVHIAISVVYLEKPYFQSRKRRKTYYFAYRAGTVPATRAMERPTYNQIKKLLPIEIIENERKA
jgi:hypothetical protein